MEEKKKITRTQCPKCAEIGKDTRRNNLAIYEKSYGTDAYCFACGYYHMDDHKITEDMLKPITQIIELKDRNLKQTTVEYYGVSSTLTNEKEHSRYYPLYQNNEIIGHKIRTLPKYFKISGKSGNELWGQHLFEKGGKILIVTEGEEDAMSAYQITEQCSPSKKGYPAVSLPHGINGSKSAVKAQLEWMNSFERVVFAVDQEEEALKIARECCEMLDLGKGRIARFPLKDASDMCVARRYIEFYNAIWAAPSPSLTGIIEGKDIWKEYKKRYDYENIKFPDEWGMNEWNYGLYRPALFILTGGTSVGKSSVAQHLQYHLLQTTKEHIGVISIEESITRCAATLMGMAISKRLTLPDCEYTEEMEQLAYNLVFKEDRFTFCSSMGVRSTKDLFNKIRYMAISRGAKYIFLDHLTAIINQFPVSEKANKNDYTEYLVNRLRELCMELNVCLFLIAHVRKSTEGSGSSYEEGRLPSEDSIGGSGAIKQYSDCTLALVRNKSDPQSPLVIHVLKDRLSGNLGRSNDLVYNTKTGWLRHKTEDLWHENHI